MGPAVEEGGGNIGMSLCDELFKKKVRTWWQKKVVRQWFIGMLFKLEYNYIERMEYRISNYIGRKIYFCF